MSLISFFYEDLGLSCLWGKMNLRAETSADTGVPCDFKWAQRFAKDEDERNREWTTSEMTLSAYIALHGQCKPMQFTTLQGVVRHSIDAEDGTSALFSIELEDLLMDSKAKGEIFQIDQSRLKIRGYKNKHTMIESFLAYYNCKADIETRPHDGAIGLPSLAEWKELFENCIWEWGVLIGLNGFKITGPNGHHIFLPALGHENDKIKYGFNTIGEYWVNDFTTIKFTKNEKYFDVGDFSSKYSRFVYRDFVANKESIAKSIEKKQTELGDKSMEEITFVSTQHQRYESEIPVMGIQNCIRIISVVKNTDGCKGYMLNSGEGYIVRIYNNDTGRPNMSDKPMRLIRKTTKIAELRGFPIKAMSPFGWQEVDNSCYGITIHYQNGQVVECNFYMYDRDVRIKYMGAF